MATKKKKKLFRSSMELREARKILDQRIDSKRQVKCPVCRRKAGPKKRPLSAPMARDLIKFYHHGKSGSVGVVLGRNRVNASGDYAKLVEWGFLKKIRPGVFKITLQGRLFVEKQRTAHSHGLFWFRKFYGLVGDQVLITDCLKTRFSYEDMMKKRGKP